MSFMGLRGNVSFIGFRYNKMPLSGIEVMSFIEFTDKKCPLWGSEVMCLSSGLEVISVLCGD